MIRVNEAVRVGGKVALPKASVVRAMLNQVMDFAGEVLPGSCALPPYSETTFLAELGERLRSSRRRCELSRRELARRSGISERYIAQIEAGKGNVSIVLLLRLASAIHVASPRWPKLTLGAPLYIGAAGRHAELLAADFGQHGDAFADLLMRGARKAQPQARA